MVAVGNIDALVLQRFRKALLDRGVGNAPQLMTQSLGVHKVHVRRLAGSVLLQLVQNAISIGIEPEDGTEIGMTDLHQFQTLGLNL